MIILQYQNPKTAIIKRKEKELLRLKRAFNVIWLVNRWQIRLKDPILMEEERE